DVAQSCGSEYKGQKSGTFADIGYFSFGLFKNLNALGGGMVVTNNEALYKKIYEEVQTYPFPKKSKPIEALFKTAIASFCTSPPGFTLIAYPFIRILSALNKMDILNNAFDLPDWERVSLKKYQKKFTNIQGLVGLEQLKKLDKNTNKRIKNAELLTSLLKSTPEIDLPEIIPEAKSIYLNYVVKIKNRDRLPKILIQKGIDVTQSFLNSCSSIKEFKEYKIQCVYSDQLVKDNLCLPIQPLLNEKYIRYLAETLKKVIQQEETV
ncbi:MAG: DegT/DnrJ/EryC1/StrS family aminotransferase, partial [Spirochaetes bacterium]|nr:DegT/DnrJ/EryC1/StrS family aminotransferase [Spirochaetota bacterium]